MDSPLKLARKKRKLTLHQVATALGIDTGNLSRIERGLQVPSKELTEKIVKFFGKGMTETKIIFPERFTNSDEAKEPSEQADRRVNPETPHVMVEQRADKHAA